VTERPITPSNMSRSYPPSGECLDGPRTPAQMIAPNSPQTPLRSRNSANIGCHRAQRSSVLLCSPARPGHSSKMKAIFEEARMAPTPSQNSSKVLYPQLPNISRSALPVTRVDQSESLRSNIAGNYPGLILQSPAAPSALPQNTPSCESPIASSGHSSGSWSDDLGYINLDSRSRQSTESPQRLVLDWLTKVPTTAEYDEDQSRTLVQDEGLYSAYGMWDTPVLSLVEEHHSDSRRAPPQTRRLHRQQDLCVDPFLNGDSNNRGVSIAQRDISDTCKRLYLDEVKQSTPLTPRGPNNTSSPHAKQTKDTIDSTVQLSPLSPNVCVERGPSRYHTSRSSPTKLPVTPTRACADTTKENLMAESESMYSFSKEANFYADHLVFATPPRRRNDYSQEAKDVMERAVLKAVVEIEEQTKQRELLQSPKTVRMRDRAKKTLPPPGRRGLDEC
jgi:hypothetical protein